MKIYPTNKNKKHKGSALVVTLIILFVIMAAAISFSMASLKERKASISSSRSGIALQNADSGIEDVMQRIWDVLYDPNNPPDPLIPPEISVIDNSDDGCDGIIKNDSDNNGDEYEVELKDEDDNKIEDCNDPVSSIKKIKSTGKAGEQARRSLEVPVIGQ